MKPVISVIIPVYNTEEYVGLCLDSVLSQTLSDIEVICADDASEDNSLQIIKEYAQKDQRVKVISYENNKGGGYARNCALDIAQGEYLAFLDSDDFFEKDFCEKMYACAKETNSDIVVCSANHYDTNTGEYKEIEWALKTQYLPSERVFSYKDMPDYIFNFSQNWNWNKLFRHDFIKNNKIRFQELFRTNDLLFTCKSLVLASGITVLQSSNPPVNYRIGCKTNCQQTNYLYPCDFYKAFYALKEFLLEENLYDDVRQSFINWALTSTVYNLYSIKKKRVKNRVMKNDFSKIISDLDLTAYDQVKIYDETALNNFLYILNDYNESKNMPIKRFLKKIFSLTDSKDKSHKIIRIFGIKFSTRRKLHA